jgi:hypothetical protein
MAFTSSTTVSTTDYLWADDLDYTGSARAVDGDITAISIQTADQASGIHFSGDPADLDFLTFAKGVLDDLITALTPEIPEP